MAAAAGERSPDVNGASELAVFGASASRIYRIMEYTQRVAIRTGLGESAFWILSALASERRHGYGLIEEVRRASNGEVVLKVATLYAVLERLERDGWATRDGEEVVDGRLRRYFRITDQGHATLAEELDRLESRGRYARFAIKTFKGATS